MGAAGRVATDRLAADVLERFYTYLLRHCGRGKRTTCVVYVTDVRAFFRFLDRRRWLHPDVSYERMKDGLRELIGRTPYKTPRVGDSVAQVVTYVNELPVPPPGAGEQARLTLLRDRALLRTLWATGMRREVSEFQQADAGHGLQRHGIVVGRSGLSGHGAENPSVCFVRHCCRLPPRWRRGVPRTNASPLQMC